MSVFYYRQFLTCVKLPLMSDAIREEQNGKSRTESVRLSPQPIIEAAWGFAITRVLTTAIELGVFTSIAYGHTTLETLVNETSCSARGLSMLLNALTALKYLDVTSSGYALSPVSAAFLTRTSPHYIGAYVMHNCLRLCAMPCRPGNPFMASSRTWNSLPNWFSLCTRSVRRPQQLPLKYWGTKRRNRCGRYSTSPPVRPCGVWLWPDRISKRV